jgi:hypothetical protein
MSGPLRGCYNDCGDDYRGGRDLWSVLHKGTEIGLPWRERELYDQ